MLLEYYGSELSAETIVGDEFLMLAVIVQSFPQSGKPFSDVSPINRGKISRKSKWVFHEFHNVNHVSKSC